MCKQGQRTATTNNLVSEPSVAVSVAVTWGQIGVYMSKQARINVPGRLLRRAARSLAVVDLFVCVWAYYLPGVEGSRQTGGEMPFH